MRKMLEKEGNRSETQAGIDAAREDNLTNSDSEEHELVRELDRET